MASRFKAVANDANESTEGNPNPIDTSPRTKYEVREGHIIMLASATTPGLVEKKAGPCVVELTKSEAKRFKNSIAPYLDGDEDEEEEGEYEPYKDPDQDE